MLIYYSTCSRYFSAKKLGCFNIFFSSLLHVILCVGVPENYISNFNYNIVLYCVLKDVLTKYCIHQLLALFITIVKSC